MPLDETNLKNERLKSEIEFFNAMTKSLTKDETKDEAKPKSKRISLAVISTLIAILSGGFVLFLKVNEFLEQRSKAYSVTYTTQMIEFVDKLKENKGWESDQAILLLSSYEMDALDILLFNLENEPANRKEVYLRSLKLIKNKETVDQKEFMDKVISSSKNYLISKFGKTYSDNEKQKQKEYALRNYIFILGGLSENFEVQVKEQLNWMKKKIKKDGKDKPWQRLIIRKIDQQLDRL